jgi:hypothetical protein
MEDERINWLAVVLILAIIYIVYFLLVNHEAITHNMGNPCVLLPMNFGACG